MLNHVFSRPITFSLDTLLLLVVLVALEAVLSADNAIALATISQGLADPKEQSKALNLGLVLAFVLRVGLIISAAWIVNFWQFELLGAAYLLYLVGRYFIYEKAQQSGEAHEFVPRFDTFWQAIPTIAFTDMAFSLDSVTAAIAVSQEIWLIITGGLLGIITLRFMAGLFLRWLDEYVYLRDAGYLTVAVVGFRLLFKVITPQLVPPQWVMITMVALLFAWGFSKRVDIIEANPDDEAEL